MRSSPARTESSRTGTSVLRNSSRRLSRCFPSPTFPATRRTTPRFPPPDRRYWLICFRSMRTKSARLERKGAIPESGRASITRSTWTLAINSGSRSRRNSLHGRTRTVRNRVWFLERLARARWRRGIFFKGSCISLRFWLPIMMRSKRSKRAGSRRHGIANQVPERQRDQPTGLGKRLRHDARAGLGVEKHGVEIAVCVRMRRAFSACSAFRSVGTPARDRPGRGRPRCRAACRLRYRLGTVVGRGGRLSSALLRQAHPWPEYK